MSLELVYRSIHTHTPIDRVASEVEITDLKSRGLVVDIQDCETGRTMPRVRPKVRHEILGIEPIINWQIKEDWDGR